MAMSEIADIRKRLRQTIEEAKRAAAERRNRAQIADRKGSEVLAAVVAPLLKAVAAALKAEGYPFRVSTPPGTARLSLESSSDDFIELTLDTTRTVPALVGRVSRTWGHRILTHETVVLEGPDIVLLTDANALEFVMAELPPFVER